MRRYLALWSTILMLLTIAAREPADAAPVCDTSSQYDYSFASFCTEPIWIGERSTSDTASYPPVGGNWAIAAICTDNTQCTSGTCDADSARCTCATTSDCAGAPCLSDGKCATWLDICAPQTWGSATLWPRTGCVLDASANPQTLTCATGSCFDTSNTGAQLLDCSVANGGGSPQNPVTQFEVTSTPGAVNYDVSIAAGYNVEALARPMGGAWIPPGATPPTPVDCLPAGCASDLNATCPTALRVTSGNDTIGCLDPCTQCQRDPTSATLQCSASAGETWTDCNGGTGSVTNEDLYCAKNFTDGIAQSSPNQGTPTSFGQIDCFPGTNFVIPTFASGFQLPAGQGVCLFTEPPQSTIPHFNDFGWADAASGTTQNCGGMPPDYVALADGTACGGYLTVQSDGADGYPNGLGYSCQTASYTDATGEAQTAHLCLPSTESGLGICTNDDVGGMPLYSAHGGVSNPAWLAAGLTAGGGVRPYYETFKNACPNAYTWQYDDASAGFACQPGLTGPTGAAYTGMGVVLCGSNVSPLQAQRPPPGQVVGLRARGAASHVGSPNRLAQIALHGRFTPASPIALDQAKLRLVNLLDEVGGSGELLGAPAGGAALPLTLSGRPFVARAGEPALTLLPRDPARTIRVRYETEPGFLPRIRVELATIPRRNRVSPIDFAIRIDGASLDSPTLCSGGQSSSTRIETAFELQSGTERALLVGGILPWRCTPSGLRAPLRSVHP